MLMFWLRNVKVTYKYSSVCGEHNTQTWEFKGEFDNTEKVYIGIVDGEVNKDNPETIIFSIITQTNEVKFFSF